MPRASASRWRSASAGTTQLFSDLISLTTARARSGSDQNPASDWSASSFASRASLFARSKKLPQLEETPVQLVDPFFHASHWPARG